MMIVLAPISVGELIDKITILEIKSEIIYNPDKIANVQRELDFLTDVLHTLNLPDISEFRQQLKQVNLEIWQVEDRKRHCERIQDFGDIFIQTSRQVYFKNDERARIKREINIMCNSDIIEEKQHNAN